MTLEKDVGELLVFICDNKDEDKHEMIATKIKDVVSKHGLNEVILNLEDRNKTPLILWAIDLLNNFSKLNKGEV